MDFLVDVKFFLLLNAYVDKIFMIFLGEKSVMPFEMLDKKYFLADKIITSADWKIYLPLFYS